MLSLLSGPGTRGNIKKIWYRTLRTERIIMIHSNDFFHQSGVIEINNGFQCRLFIQVIFARSFCHGMRRFSFAPADGCTGWAKDAECLPYVTEQTNLELT